MIIRTVTVHNFGVFRGRHEIDFTPAAADRPIVLIGAMNGSGKTTLLEALKLALYGRRATDLSRGSRSYDDFLAESVHRGVPMSDGAAIEVTFTLLAGGRDCIYRIVRAWSGVPGQARESFEAYVEDVFDPVLSEGWNEHVESILPVRLAPFFLFDGERLETLADPARARDFLANAIEALLGLDIVDRLGDDLRAVERRIREGVVETSDDQAQLAMLQAQVEVSDREVLHLMQRCGELTNALDAARRGTFQAQRELEAMTGDLPTRSLALQKEHASFSGRRADALGRLMDLAYEDGPLILLQDALKQVLQTAAPDDLNSDLLAERDRQILATMKRKRIAADVVARVEAILSEDLGQRAALSRGKVRAQRSLLTDAIQNARVADQQAEDSIRSLEASEGELSRVEDLIRALPTVQSLEPLVAAVREWEASVTAAEVEHRLATEALERARKGREGAESRMQDIYASALDRAKQQRYVSKLTARAGELRKTLEAFRLRMAARHAATLGEIVLEAFQCLHRKLGTIERIIVDSRTFEMTLFDDTGRRIDPARLSAGERQLLAVAMVWAILKAAGRPLPLWIDTPLGRLDSVHRRHLVERFFPFAAPQVVLLSTDTEIDAEAHAVLMPYVSQTYRIEFDPGSRASTCVPGYFLEQAA